MREVAKDAQKAGVFSDANRNVQRACEIYKKTSRQEKMDCNNTEENRRCKTEKIQPAKALVLEEGAETE